VVEGKFPRNSLYVAGQHPRTVIYMVLELHHMDRSNRGLDMLVQHMSDP
jgi:hypothetical protein